MPEDATREDLRAYHRLLRAQGDIMAQLQDSLDERKRRADESSIRRMLVVLAGLGSVHGLGSARGSTAEGEPRRREGRIILENVIQGVARNLGAAMDEEADLIPKTTDAARMALAAYLSLNQPPEGDPRIAVHKAALIAADMLGKEATPLRSSPRRNSPYRERGVDHNLHSTLTQRSMDRRREEREDRGGLEFDEENDPIRATCFSRSIRCTKIPVDFKPPTEIAKYTGAQEPK